MTFFFGAGVFGSCGVFSGCGVFGGAGVFAFLGAGVLDLPWVLEVVLLVAATFPSDTEHFVLDFLHSLQTMYLVVMHLVPLL